MLTRFLPFKTLALTTLDYSSGQFEHCGSTQEQIYSQFGGLNPKQDTTSALKIYSADEFRVNAVDITNLPSRFQSTIKEFAFIDDPKNGINFCAPNFRQMNYATGVVWIFNPKIAYGSFYDEQYTRAWRISHELAHAIVEPFLHMRYQKSRRNGRIGRPHRVNWNVKHKDGKLTSKPHIYDPLSIRLAQRSVEWESLAFRVQRMLLEDCKVNISDSEYAQEYNVNISDAMYRAITGQFGEPGKYGMVPFSILPNLRDLLQIIEDAGDQIGKETGDVAPVKDRIDLTRWVPISDQYLRDAIYLCQKNGISSFSKNYTQQSLLKIPPLYDSRNLYH